jgi:hypothetical protein
MATTNQKEQFEETYIYSANTTESLEMPAALESIGDPEKGEISSTLATVLTKTW